MLSSIKSEEESLSSYDDLDIISIDSFPKFIVTYNKHFKPRRHRRHSTTTTSSSSSQFHMLWTGVCRNETILAEATTNNNNNNNQKHNFNLDMILKIRKVVLFDGRCTDGWNFITYAVKNTKVHAVKFHVFEEEEEEKEEDVIAPGTRVTLQGILEGENSYLNGKTAEVINFIKSSNQYIVRPEILLDGKRFESATGVIMVDPNNVKACCSKEQQQQQQQQPQASSPAKVWTFASLYIGRDDQDSSEQSLAATFLESMMSLAQQKMQARKEWQYGGYLACQHYFAPILMKQMTLVNNLEWLSTLYEEESCYATAKKENNDGRHRVCI